MSHSTVVRGTGINGSGKIVGGYINNVFHGFLDDKGSFTTIDRCCAGQLLRKHWGSIALM